METTTGLKTDIPLEPKKDVKRQIPELKFRKTFWIVAPIIATASYIIGGVHFDKEKSDLYDDVKGFKKDTAYLHKHVAKLLQDSTNYTLRTIGDANTQKGNTNQLDISPPSQKNIPSEQQKNKNSTTVSSNQPVQVDQQKESSKDLYAIEINKLRTENNVLKRNLELITSEKKDLKRKIQKYISAQDSLATELEFIRDEISKTSGKENEDAKKEFSELLKKSKAERFKFDETQDGKDFAQEVESERKKQAERDQKAKEQDEQVNMLTKELNEIKGQSAEYFYDSAIDILRKAEKIRNWFGIRSKLKTDLIQSVKKYFQKANELGKDCSSEIKILEEDYPECFK